MRTPTEFQVKVISANKKLVTFSLGISSTYILGSSVPLIAPRDRPVALFSVPILKENTPILIFLGCALKIPDSSTFLKIEYRENKVWLNMKGIPPFPYEMFVIGNNVTVKLPKRGLASTCGTQGAYRVTHDALCKFLIGDITEEELLAEEVLLRRLCGLENEPQQCLESTSRALATRDNK